MNKTLTKICRKIKYLYWSIIPYDWRPSNIWYRFTCFIWYRYTTIKPRTLKFHTWCDRDKLIVHMCFEILSQFLEEECSPGHIDWYYEVPSVNYEGKKIEVNGEKKWVIDEMWDLYHWWHDKYNGEYIRIHEENMAKLPNVNEGKDFYKKLNDLEYQYEEVKLPEMMHRLVNIIPYMWT